LGIICASLGALNGVPVQQGVKGELESGTPRPHSRASGPALDLGARRIARQGERSAGGRPRYIVILPKRLNALWELLWEERRTAHFALEVLDPLPPRPGTLPAVLNSTIDLGERRVSRQGVHRGAPRFTITLPLALNHAWGEIWRARARVRVVAEVARRLKGRAGMRGSGWRTPTYISTRSLGCY